MSAPTKAQFLRDPFLFADLYCRVLTKKKGTYSRLGVVHKKVVKHFAAHHRRAMVLMPRDHLKTTLVRAWALWEIWRKPQTTCIYWCLTLDRAKQAIQEMRTIIETVPFLRDDLMPESPRSWSVDKFTVRNGSASAPSFLAAAFNVKFTGAHADIGIFDDVIDRSQSESEEKRKKAVEFAENAQFVIGRGRIRVIGTRWHSQDLYATLRRRGYNTLVFPAILEAPAPEGSSEKRRIPLWPERYTLADLEQMRQEQGAANFAMQMMLDPSPPELRQFPDMFLLDDDRYGDLPAGRTAIFVDMAYTDKDPRRRAKKHQCAIAALAVSITEPIPEWSKRRDERMRRMYIVEDGFERADISVDEAIDLINAMSRKYNNAPIYAERLAEARAFRTDLSNWRRLHPRSEDKMARIDVLKKACRSRCIVLLNNEIGSILRQAMADWPHPRFMDALDALAYAVIDGERIWRRGTVSPKARRLLRRDDIGYGPALDLGRIAAPFRTIGG